MLENHLTDNRDRGISTMKLAIFAIVALASVTLAARTNLLERKGLVYNHAMRLGHLNDTSFLDLYLQYANAFVIPTISPAPAHQDTRYYRPSKDICITFLQNFINVGYKVDDLDKFVVLDACLGYVMDKVYLAEAEDDDEFVAVKPTDRDVATFDALSRDENLVKLYNSEIESFTPAEKTCVADLLTREILGKNQFKGVKCNDVMIQTYIQFAECQEAVGGNLTPESQDSYVKTIYGLLRDRVDVCFKEELKHIEDNVRIKFSKSKLVPFLGSLTGNSLRKQQYKNMLPTEIVEVLTVVQGANKQFNARRIHQILSSKVNQDDAMEKVFLNNLANYATTKLSPRRKSKFGKKDKFYMDQDGALAYTDLIDNLCNPFRVSTSNEYNFALSLIKMVRLLKHRDMFNVSVDQFVQSMVEKTHEGVAVYLATYACNLMTYTHGTFQDFKHERPQYVVNYKADTSEMVVWPLSLYL